MQVGQLKERSARPEPEPCKDEGDAHDRVSRVTRPLAQPSQGVITLIRNHADCASAEQGRDMPQQVRERDCPAKGVGVRNEVSRVRERRHEAGEDGVSDDAAERGRGKEGTLKVSSKRWMRGGSSSSAAYCNILEIS